ncbi:MAG TPA: amidohydrolase family protein [Bryobacteraceae bacterium]|nr:amidohydrolase family protein [Bryobacteraceae bacterium]
MKNLAATLIVFYACAAAQPQPTAVAIRNARIVTVSGSPIAKGTIVIRNGLIEAVGDSIQAPSDALVIDGEGLTVYPGLVDALSTWGMPGTAANGRGGRGAVTPAPAAPPSRGPEDRPATTSWIKAADEIQATDRRIEAARNAGFTTAVVFPTRGIFGGQGSIINLADAKSEGMVLVPSAGQYITLGRATSGYPNALMGSIAYIRQIYLDAEHYRLVKEAYDKNPRGMKRPEYDRALEGVLESKRILLPANREVEIDRMLHFAAELKQPAILYGMREGYRAAEVLKKSSIPVLVSLKWPAKTADSNPDEVDTYRTLEDREKAPTSPRVLRQAGVKFAFYSDGIDQTRELQRAVKKAIDSGLSREDAVRALTLSPAEIYSVADRLGSLEKGKIANLVVTRGEIFEDRTHVEMVFVDGVKHIPAPEPAGRGGAPTENPGAEK